MPDGSHPPGAVSTRRELGILLAATVVLGSAFVILAAEVWHANAPVTLDRALGRLGVTAGEDGLLGGNTRLALIGEWLGSREGVGLSAAALLALAVIWRDWLVGLLALLAPLGSFFVTEYLAKPLINEPIRYGGRTFPSGHSAGVAAVATMALVLLYRRWGGSAVALFAPVAVASTVLVGLAVLRLDFHHYPTDVLGGIVLGATSAVASTFLLAATGRRLRPRYRQPARSNGT